MSQQLNFILIAILLTIINVVQTLNSIENDQKKIKSTPCTCGIFLSGQIKDPKEQPEGNAVLLQVFDRPCLTGPAGIRQCTSKCLDLIVKHLANSPPIICATIGRDCFKENAHLFIKNEDPMWFNTKLSAGREFCCKNNLPFKCPS